MLRRAADHDGHWSVSVAESPYDPHSYSIYIKTPTHNLTLTRTATEIIDLDHKLRQAHTIPDLPANLPLPPKRKSTFLNTLSRLASPASAKHNRRPTTTSTPVVEYDVFTTGADPEHAPQPTTMTAVVPPPSATATALAAYLTSVANVHSIRTDRVWKRFVRVRTDDLESVRVERAIKRVRSDLAAHSVKVEDSTSPAKVEHPIPIPTQGHSQLSSDHPSSVLDGQTDIDEEDSSTFPSTPLASSPRPQTIIPRSQSADPDKSHRFSRSFIPDSAAEESQTTTGDESSIAAPESTLIIHSPSMDGADTFSATTTASEYGGTKRRLKKPRKSDASRSTNKKSKAHRKVCIDDFEMLRVLGKGCAGKVLLVRHKNTSDLFALKAITKRHVLAHQELQHTLTEQAVLKRMAAENRDPFVVRLWWSFHDKENLFLVMDFHPGGDLATQLARWGRLGRDRARFYAAEIVEGVEGLHAAGVIYRDLKPENILIGGDGHIVLTDFGLSKEFPRIRNHQPASPSLTGGHSHPHGTSFYSSVPGTPQPVTPPWMKSERNGEVSLGWGWPPTSSLSSSGGSNFNGSNTSDMTKTFCGTAEYLAPEVIQGFPYSYEVDWWSFGTMLYEMLTGITPFWANNHDDMYVRVLQDELHFPEDRAIDQDTKSLIRGLLQRVPSLRICEPRIKKHPYFSMIDWSHVYYKRYIPPYIPPIDPSNASDTQNFDETFLDMEPVLDEYQEEPETEQEKESGSEGGRRLGNGALTDVDTDQEPCTDGVDTEDGRTGNGVDTDVDEDHNGTPLQSRSSSVLPMEKVEAGVNGSPVAGKKEHLDLDLDVFDGYSFKGRESVLLEEEDGGSSEGSYDEGEGEVESESVVREAISEEGVKVVEVQVKDGGVEEEEEPKTPGARHVGLPAIPSPGPQPIVSGMGEEEIVESRRVEEEAVSAEGAVDGHVDEDTGQDGVPPPLPPKPTGAIPGLLTIIPTTPTTATTTTPSTTTTTTGPALRSRPRKERSGVPALDRYLSDTIEERSPCASDASASENEEASDGDDDWDLIEAGDGEDRNGLGMGGVGGMRVGRGVGVGMRVRMKGGSLFARGVVDRYRLKVFGNKSSSGAAGSGGDSSSGLNAQSRGRRVVSGMSVISGRSFGSSTLGGINGGSPSQKKEQKDKEKQKQKEKEERRGRAPGLTFKKHPREFLRARSPKGSTATTATSKTSVMAGGSSSPSGYHTVPVSAASSLAGILLTPSHSVSSYRFDKEKETAHSPNINPTNSPGSPSLKSKESAMSVGGQSASSDQSANGPYVHVEVPDATASELMLGLGMTMNPNVNMSGKKMQQQQQRKMKLKKYKNNAEKVLSLFSSPKGGQQGLGQSNSNSGFVHGQNQGHTQAGGVEAAQSLNQLGQGHQQLQQP